MGALLIALMSSASAELVNWSIQGSVTTITDPGSPALWASSISSGAPIHLTFWGDSSVAPSFSLPALGIVNYDLTGASLDLGDLHFDLTAPSLALSHDPASIPMTIALGAASSVPAFTVTVQLTSSQDVLPTLDFPKTLPLLSNFDLAARITIMETTPSSERWEAIGTISQLQSSASPVPEPSSYALFGSAAALVLCFRRCIRRK